MPVTHGQGHSAVTPDKQRGLSAMLALHMRVVANVFEKHKHKTWFRSEYHYIDTNAGSGANPEEGVDGSPLIFLDRVRYFRNPWHGHFVEKEKANVEVLRSRLNGSLPSNAHIHHGDNAEIVPRIIADIPPKSFGLVYMDTNGTPSWDLLASVSKEQPKIDILIRCPTRVLKRTRYQGSLSLVDAMDMVGKEAWLIRDTIRSDRWDFTFLFGANYGFGEWGSERFYKTSSARGKEILERLNYTKAEIEHMHQASLFVEQEVRDRSGGICEVCEESDATEIHHEKGSYGQLDARKRIHVCHECHCTLEGVDD